MSAKSVHNERLAYYAQVRTELYDAAKRNDSETVAAFEAYAQARRPK